ncbi:MAG: DUF1501 domain-containing protein [Bacteroidota bacterium]|nr:DUF1501 domain-containing protein [Bacteroidota bacterium]MDP4229744.1 DUF1501 domain-containing protein [Bacteroidota bacterium]MDP4235876.1 DUF1501 domain-containing protein [Bacteroidota bacterium]
MKRRDFIKSLPLGVAAAAVPFSIGGLFSGKAFGRSPALDVLLNAQGNSNNVLVLINLQGGNDGLNTVIPFQDPQYDINRKDVGYYTPSEKALLTPFQLRGDLALNPPLGTDFYNMFKDGKLAVLQNVGYSNPNRSHFRATDIWNSASDSELVVFTGWMGRYLETQVPENYPIDIGSSPDPLAIAIDYSTSLVFQGSRSVMASAVIDPSKYNAAQNYADDTPPNTNAGNELQFVRGILTQSDKYGKRFKDVFALPGATQNTVTYPTTNPLAVQLQKVAWCIKAGLQTRVYFVSLGGFDTHVSQYTKDPTQGQGLLHTYLGEAISLFQKDIENMNVADNVIGMTYSEFGRRVNQNGSLGTDHGTSAPMFLFGKEINGEVYGHNPKLDAADLDVYGDLVEQFDFRQVYASILTQWFGIDDYLRKSILNKPEFTSVSDFQSPTDGFKFPVNGSGTMQNIIRNPVPMSVSQNGSLAFNLYQNQPNPFPGITTIKFALSEGGPVLLEVFDGRGSLVKTLVNGYRSRGENQVIFDGLALPSGTYYCRIAFNGKTQTRSMTLTK